MRSPYEIKAQKELEAEGKIVDNKAGMSRWCQNRDFFNLFDLVALDPKTKILQYISIKGTVGLLKDHQEEIRALPLPDCIQKELWCRSKGKDHYWNKVLIN